MARFTPTPVGTTSRSWLCAVLTSVHPHARGDDVAAVAAFVGIDGSPPRPWGRHTSDRAALLDNRFTPTPVGTTPAEHPTPPQRPVHPHARGDDCVVSLRAAYLIGSPPRPWGRHYYFAALPMLGRFTPTPVGTTSR